MGAETIGRLTGRPHPTPDELLERFRVAVGELGELGELLRVERPGLAAGRLLEIAVSQYLVPIGQSLHQGVRRRCGILDEWDVPCSRLFGHGGPCAHAAPATPGREP